MPSTCRYPKRSPAFKENFERAGFIPTYGIKDDKIALTGLTVTVNGKTYRNMKAVKEDNRQWLAQLPPLTIDFGQGGNPSDTPAPTAPRQSGPADVDLEYPGNRDIGDLGFRRNHRQRAIIPGKPAVPFATGGGRYSPILQQDPRLPEKTSAS